MSFSCPHYDPVTDYCDRVRDRCVCGRPGCVLARNSTFAIPPDLRLSDPAAPLPGTSPAQQPPAPDPLSLNK